MTPLIILLNCVRSLSTIGKIVGILFMALALLIPVFFIEGLLQDRLSRRDQAISDIDSTWGPNQQIVGPILIVPFTYKVSEVTTQLVNGTTVNQTEDQIRTDTAYFLPKRFDTEGSVSTDHRHRGIYEAIIYQANLHFTGEFAPVDFTPFRNPNAVISWDQVSIAFPISDLRGVEQTLKIKVGGNDIMLQPGSTVPVFPQGLHGDVHGLTQGMGIPFDLELNLHGSSGISFVPVGVDNSIHLTSPWADPEFKGAFLPDHQTVTPAGFDATWNVSFYGRNFPQQWLASESTSNDAQKTLTSDMIGSAAYGVDFLNLVDSYRNVERAIKYAILFIALVFVTFFLFETLSRTKIHLIQYGLVGAALVLFYLALLSLSEFVDFGWAYAVATGASVLLITFYCITVLKSRLSAYGLALGLVLVYSILYVILQLQDYSLLVGTAGLFVALGAVMYVTRNIDWHGAADEKSKPVSEPTQS